MRGIDPLPVESSRFRFLDLPFPANRAARASWNGNVSLANPRGKLRHHIYNPLQVKEFRINYLVGRLVRTLSGIQ